MKPTTRCFYCDRPATLFCDRVDRAGKSCDRPLCVIHAKPVGHICDRSRRTTNNRSDTIDFCRVHPDEIRAEASL